MTEIAIIGEAWGAEEERERAPFVGSSGYLLTKMLEEASIRRADCFLTNVLNLRPPNNKLEALCGPKPEGIKGFPAITKAKYLREEFAPELDRLGRELVEVNPNLIIALGNTALWALCGRTAITKARGTTCLSTHTVSGFKVLPTYHPAAVGRQWQLRPVTVVDLCKAERESHFAEIRRPKREIWIEPELEDLEEFYERYISPNAPISVDIETVGTSITCIGFAVGTSHAIVIPFLDPRRKTRSYWPDPASERAAWEFVRRVLEDGKLAKVFQNGLYDIAFIWRTKGIKIFGAEEDTMLLHHAMQPESLKGLGFLGSVYTDEGAWKQMRTRSTTIKKDD